MSEQKRITWSSSGQNGITFHKIRYALPKTKDPITLVASMDRGYSLQCLRHTSTSRHTDICETISDIMNCFWFVCFILQTDCTSNQVRCSDGRCIPSNWICGFYYCPFGTNGTGAVDCSKFFILQWIHAR